MLERDPIKTAWDVENGFLTREAAEKVFGIILKEDAEGYPQADIDATVARRAELRKKRLKQAIPVSEWIAREQRRVEASDFAPEVAKMYRSAMKLSPRFSRDFKEFWGLASDFAIAGEN